MNTKKEQLYRVSENLVICLDSNKRASLNFQELDRKSMCGKFASDKKMRLEGGAIASILKFD